MLDADLDVVAADLHRTEIRAPFGGFMGLREVSPGAFLTPERVVARLRETDPLRLEFSLPPGAASGRKDEERQGERDPDKACRGPESCASAPYPRTARVSRATSAAASDGA